MQPVTRPNVRGPASATRMGLLVIALGGLVAAAVWLGPPRPAALPPGATPLVLLTQSWRPWPPSGFGCANFLVFPIRVERDGNALLFTRVDNGERQSIVWPAGYSARLLSGRAELVAPDGDVVARERDVINDLGGTEGDNGEIVLCRFDFASKPVVDHAP